MICLFGAIHHQFGYNKFIFGMHIEIIEELIIDISFEISYKQQISQFI
jgi:hypothetical protein